MSDYRDVFQYTTVFESCFLFQCSVLGEFLDSFQWPSTSEFVFVFQYEKKDE